MTAPFMSGACHDLITAPVAAFQISSSEPLSRLVRNLLPLPASEKSLYGPDLVRLRPVAMVKTVTVLQNTKSRSPLGSNLNAPSTAHRPSTPLIDALLS